MPDLSGGSAFVDVLPSMRGYFQRVRREIQSNPVDHQIEPSVDQSALSKAQKQLEQATAKASAARRKEADAVDAVAVAEAKLQTLIDKGVTDAGRLTAARAAVAKATRNQVAAAEALQAAESGQRSAEGRVVRVQARLDSAEAEQQTDTFFQRMTGRARTFGSGFSGILKGAATGAAAAIGIVASQMGEVLERGNLQRSLRAQLDLTAEESKRAGAIAGNVFAQNYGGSMAEVTDAVGAVAGSLALIGDATDAEMEDLTKRLLVMSQTFGMDVNELAMSTSLLMRNGIAANGQEATDMLMAAFQRVPPAMRGELMPIVDEYGGYLTGLGFTGQEAMGLIVNAAQNGAIGMDKMGDSLKEFQIRATDMSEATAGAYEILGMNQTDMTNRLLAGGDTAKTAFREIMAGLEGIQDPAAQSQAALALFGTPLEDLGVDKIPMFLKQLSNADSAMGEFEGSVNEAGDVLAGGPLESITVFGREMQNKIVGLLDDNVLPLFGEFTGALEDSEGNALAAAASMVGLGGAVGGFEEAKGVFDSVKEGVVGVKDSLVSAKDTAVSAWGSLKDAGGWVKTQATAVGSFVKTSASATVEAAKTATSWTITHAKVAGGWLVAQAKAVGSFIATAAAATFHAGVTALQWLIAQGRIAGGWVLTQVQAIASFVAVAAAAALHAGATALQWIIANGRIVASFVATRVAMFASAAATGVMTAAQWLLNAALNANPIGLIVIALAALAAAVIWAWNNVDWFRDAVLTAWDWIKNAVSFAWENVLRPVLGFLGDRLRDAANAFVWLKDKAVAALQWIGDKALDIVGFFTSLPGKILGALGNGARMLYDWGRDMIQGLLDGAGSLLSKIGQFFLDKVPDWIRGPFEKALGIASPSKVFIAYGGNIGQGLIDGTKAMTGQVQATAQQLADAAADVTLTAPTPTPGLPATTAVTGVGADPAAAVGLGFDTETALTGITDLATGLQTTAAAVITPTVTGMQTGLTQYAETFPRVNDTLVQPAMTAMGLGIAAARTSLIDPALNAMQANTVRTGQVTTDVVNSTVVPQWQRMGAGIVGVKNGSIDPAFAGIQGGLRTVEGAFATGVSAISSQWDQMRGAVGRPVRFAIDTVFNNGLVGMWNSVSDLIGTQRMNPYVVGGFATGTSVLPGYSPGVDNLRFYTADGSTAIDLSGGEGIARPEVVRAMGTHEFDGLNAAARMGGVRGVRRYLGGFAGGGIVESIVDKVRRFFPGMSITSTYRNSNDLHGAGKAVDFSDGYDTTPGMQAAARFFYRNYGGMLAELIHWPLNGWQNVDEGRPFDFGAGTNAQHRNHVHVAAHRPLPEPGTVTDSLGAAGAPMWSFADYVKEQTRAAKDATAAAVGQFSAPGIVGSLPAKTYESMFTAADNKIQELAKAADIALGAGDMVERWRPTVIAALKRTGNPLSDAERTLQQIRIESGGDPNAINLWDINAQNGDPSVGLIQIINSTFQRWRDQSLPDDRRHPLANLVAGMRYAVAEYGSLANIWPKSMGYDQGGRARGKGLMFKDVIQPERVLDPDMTRSFDEKLIPILDRLTSMSVDEVLSAADRQALVSVDLSGAQIIGQHVEHQTVNTGADLERKTRLATKRAMAQTAGQI